MTTDYADNKRNRAVSLETTMVEDLRGACHLQGRAYEEEEVWIFRPIGIIIEGRPVPICRFRAL